MSEIGSLIIKLQAQTAEFQADLGKVKGKLNDLGDTAGKAGKKIDFSIRESNESVIAMGEMFGVHLPESITRTLATLGPLGPALEAALPFAALALGASLLVEHITKVHEAAQKLAEAQSHETTTIDGVFNSLDDKLIEAQKEADDLAGHHLAAVHKELELIDHASLKDLAGEFDIVAGAVDKVLETMKKQESFLDFGKGVEGAKDALDKFKNDYDELLAEGRKKEASDLLAGTLDSAQKILALQEQANKSQHQNVVDPSVFAAIRTLHQQNITFTDADIAAQKELVRALTAQVAIQQQVNATKNQQVSNVKNKFEKDVVAKNYEDALKYQESYRNKSESLANEGMELGDKLAKENADAQIKANTLVQKQSQEALEQQLSDKVVALHSQQDVLEQSHALGLVSEQDYYEQLKAVYKAEHDAQMSYLTTQKNETVDPDRKLNIQKQITQEQERYNSELIKTNTALAKIDSSWNNYFAKMKSETLDLSTTVRTQLQSSLTEFTHSFSEDVAKSIVEGKNLGQSLRREAAQIAESWIEMAIRRIIMDKLVLASHLSSNAETAASDKTTAAQSQVSAAKAGAAKAGQAVAGIPFVGPALAIAASAATFVALMAFEKGGKIPGEGAVPILGHGGETVVTKALTDRVERAEQSGSNSGMTMHAHFAPQIHAIDADGVDGLLKKHGATFTKHIARELRSMNK